MCKANCKPQRVFVSNVYATLVVLAIFAALFSGCSNSYKKFYKGTTYSNNTGRCRIEGQYNKGSAQEIIKDMRRRGFTYIGASSFWSANAPSDMDALSACNSIGGDAVYVMIPEYRGSRTYEYETTQYHPGQSYYQVSSTKYNGNSNYNGYVYGGDDTYYYGGNVQTNGTATTTTYGRTPGYTTTQTHYAVADVYNYEALFFYYDENSNSVGYYSDSPKEKESRYEYAECMRRDDYVEPDDVCSGRNTAIGGKVYWNAQMQKCMPYNRQSNHVLHFCD